jgi:hypothetical protein
MPLPDLSQLTAAASFVAKKMAIDAACFVTTDEGTMSLARGTALAGKPKALAMLDHYLDGTGTDVAVKTNELFQEDPSVASHFLAKAKPDVASGKKEGSVPVTQAVYSNQDWRNALGSINLQWKAVGNGVVEVWFINRYRWHPTAPRVSQCVHQAADNLRNRSTKPAAEFDMVGTHYRVVP